MITILFEPHATSEDNERGIASGHADIELSARGVQQAEELGARYRDVHVDAVFCSDLRRAYRTGEIAFAGREIRMIRDPRLRECDYGDWTRRSSDDVKAEGVRRITDPFPNGESYAQAAARMKSFLGDVLAGYAGKQLLVVGHRATHYGLEHWVNGVPLKDILAAPWRWQPGWTYVLEEI